MATPGHPFETAELDNLRSQQRRVLSAMPDLSRPKASVSPSNDFAREDLVAAELWVRREIQRLEESNERLDHYLSECERLAGRLAATKLIRVEDLRSLISEWEAIAQPEPGDIGDVVRQWVHLASFADSLADAAVTPQ